VGSAFLCPLPSCPPLAMLLPRQERLVGPPDCQRPASNLLLISGSPHLYMDVTVNMARQ